MIRMKFSVLLFVSLLFVAFQTVGQNKVNELKKVKFNLDKAGEDKIGYAQAVRVGNTIYVSGSVGWGKMEDAMKLAYDEIDKTLKNYHATFKNVVKENLYTTALDSVIKHKDLRMNYYGTDYPAAIWAEVQRLYNPGLVVEIEVIAELPEDK
ncbi:MAG TPA: Rid family hydrolase [Prolixibacteraceae bacterium]|nr:Rid family hydrolase [Prolixibacteraceae bacterium]HPS13323.1 Rid family hydrolase [Prolixibacteraceae bacterium]